jgi:uncharacterized cupredoxin-like copper-binding protein
MKTLLRLMVCVMPLLLIGCGGTEDADSANLEVTLQDYEFVPNTYSVPAGAAVNLTLVNNGTVEHEWVLFEKDFRLGPGEAFGDDAEGHIFWEGEVGEPGGSETFTFTAPTEAGDYQVVCGIEGHYEQGMEAAFTVQP